MICKNLQELREMVNTQCQAIRTDLANAINNFIQAKHTSVQKLASVLGLSENTIEALLHGTRDITLMELITLMIATDKVVRIEDVNEAMGNMGNHQGMPYGRMPMGNRNRRMPMPPFGGMPNPNQFGAPIGGGMPNPYGGMPNPNQFGAPIGGGMPNPYGGQQMPPFGAPIGGGQQMPPMPPQFGAPVGGGQQMPPFGAPVGGGQQMPPMPPQFDAPVEGGQQMPPIFGDNEQVSIRPSDSSLLPDFDQLSRPQLIDFVRNHVENWQHSFANLEQASRSDIISFLNSIPTDDVPQVDAPNVAPQMPNVEAFNYEQIGKNIAQMAQQNPALARMLDSIMKK